MDIVHGMIFLEDVDLGSRIVSCGLEGVGYVGWIWELWKYSFSFV